MSFHDALAAIEVKVRDVFHVLDGEARQALEQALADAKAEAGKVEADVRADIQAQLLPRLEQLKAEAAVAIEAAGPSVTAAVTKVIDAAVADLAKLADLEHLAGAGQ